MADDTELHLRGYNDTVDALAAAERGISDFYSKQRLMLTQHTQYWQNLTNQLTQAQTAAQKHTQKTREELGYFGKQLEEIQSRLLKVFSVVEIERFTREAITEFASMDRAMRSTQQITRETEEQMSRAKDKLYEIEKATGQSAEKLAGYRRDFRGQLLSLGEGAEDLFGPVAKAAAVVGTATSNMSEASVAALNNMKIPAKEFEEVLREWSGMLPGLASGFGHAFGEASRTLETLRIGNAKTAEQFAANVELITPKYENATQAANVTAAAIDHIADVPQLQFGIKQISDSKGDLVDYLRLNDKFLSDMGAFRDAGVLRRILGGDKDLTIYFQWVHEHLDDIKKEQEKAAASGESIADRLEKANGKPTTAINELVGSVHQLRDAIGEVASIAATPIFENLTKYIERMTRAIQDSQSGAKPGPRTNTSIRGFQSGGVINQPTMGMVGESGPEAVIPMADLQKARERDQAEQQRSANEQQQKDQAEAAASSRIHKLVMQAKASKPFHDWDDLRRRSDDTSGDGEYADSGAGGGGSSGGGGASGSWGGGGGGGGGGGRRGGRGGGPGGTSSDGGGTDADPGLSFGTTTPGTGKGAPGLATAVTADSSGQVDPQALYNRYVTLIRGSKLEGVKPKDGAEFGIVNGTAEEYARLALAITMQENSMSAKVNVHGGLNQFAQKDINAWVGHGADVADPDVQAQALVNVMKKFVPQDGVITNPSPDRLAPGMGVGQYFGSIRRNYNGPGIDILRYGHLKQAGVVATKVGVGDGSTFNPLFTGVNPNTGGPVDMGVLQRAAAMASSGTSHDQIYNFITKTAGLSYVSGENCAEFVTAVLQQSEGLPKGVLPKGVGGDYAGAASYLRYGTAVGPTNAQPLDVLAEHDQYLSHAMIVGPGGYDPKTHTLDIMSANRDRHWTANVDPTTGKFTGSDAWLNRMRIGHLDLPKKDDGGGGWSPGTGQFEGFVLNAPAAAAGSPPSAATKSDTSYYDEGGTDYNMPGAEKFKRRPGEVSPVQPFTQAEMDAQDRAPGHYPGWSRAQGNRPNDKPSEMVSRKPKPAPTPSPAQPTSQAASDAAADPSKAAVAPEAAGPPLSLKSTPSHPHGRRRMQEGGLVTGADYSAPLASLRQTTPPAALTDTALGVVKNVLSPVTKAGWYLGGVLQNAAGQGGEPFHSAEAVQAFGDLAITAATGLGGEGLAAARAGGGGLVKSLDRALVEGEIGGLGELAALKAGSTLKTGVEDVPTGGQGRAPGAAVKSYMTAYERAQLHPLQAQQQLRSALEAPIRPEIEAPRPPSMARMMGARRRASRQQDHWTSNAETRYHRHAARADTGAI